MNPYIIKRSPRTYVKERPVEAYPREIKNIIDIITLDQTAKPQVVGSFHYQKQKYPSDIDLSTDYSDEGRSVSETAHDVARHIQEMIKRIKLYKESRLYFSEFKTGVDTRYEVPIGEFAYRRNKEGIPTLFIKNYVPKAILARFSDLRKNGLLSEQEYTQWRSLVRPRPSYFDHDALHQAIRSKYILRWSEREILSGYKKLPQNKKISLAEALTQKTVTKLDVIALLERAIEITNFFIISAKPSGSKRVRYLTDNRYKVPVFLRHNLNREIALFMLPDAHKAMKLAKRLWLKARNENNQPLLVILQNLFDHGALEVSQIISNIDTMITVLKNIPHPPKFLMDTYLQRDKFRLASIDKVIIPDTVKWQIYSRINQINVKTFSTEALYGVMMLLKESLNAYVLQYLRMYVLPAFSE